jgi:GNAT superfamily N-acetyltransferase
MAYQSLSRTEEIDLYAASLDDPSGFRATEHVHWNERLPWLHLADGLPVRRSPRRLTQDDDPTPVLALIRATFAYMDGRIDPPSSIHAVTPADVTRQAETGEIWVLDEPGRPVACVFLTLKSRALYVGKLAVDPAFRRQGLARQLIGHAVARAHVLGCDRLELQSRVELVENHRAFRAMGFKKTGETAHPGYDRPTSFTFTKTLGDS